MERKNVLKKIKRVVIKIGTNVLTGRGDRLDVSLMEHLGEQTAWLVSRGREVIIVTSGAIGAGMQSLGWKKKPEKLERLQAAASVGQSRLMRFYERIFKEQGYNVGQVLLTRDIFGTAERSAMARATLNTLLSCGIIPVINENDAVAVDEIKYGEKFGDNDYLSALVVKLLDADALVLLSNVDGFFDFDPGADKRAKVIPEIKGITEELRAIARNGKPSPSGSGGMKSKIQAVEEVLKDGKVCFFANGRKDWVLKDIFAGRQTGTIFYPGERGSRSSAGGKHGVERKIA